MGQVQRPEASTPETPVLAPERDEVGLVKTFEIDGGTMTGATIPPHRHGISFHTSSKRPCKQGFLEAGPRGDPVAARSAMGRPTFVGSLRVAIRQRNVAPFTTTQRPRRSPVDLRRFVERLGDPCADIGGRCGAAGFASVLRLAEVQELRGMQCRRTKLRGCSRARGLRHPGTRRSSARAPRTERLPWLAPECALCPRTPCRTHCCPVRAREDTPGSLDA